MIWKVALVAAVAVNLYSMYAPRVPGPSSSLRLDLVGHALSFAALTLTGLMAGLNARWWLPLVALNALASELIQGFFLTNRSGDGGDLMADAVGITLGWLVARWLARPGMSRRYLDQQACRQAALASLSFVPGTVFTT